MIDTSHLGQSGHHQETWGTWRYLSFNQRVLGSSPSALTKPYQALSCWSGLVLLPRKPDWEAYRKQARQGEFFRRDRIGAPAGRTLLPESTNVRNQSESGLCHGLAEWLSLTQNGRSTLLTTKTVLGLAFGRTVKSRTAALKQFRKPRRA